MPSVPTQSGLFIPGGYLNTNNSSSPSGQGDAYGNIYPSGTTNGKTIFVTQQEAANLVAPGSPHTLLEGAYQWVQLDSGATAANCVDGMAAYIRFDSGPTVGALPETNFANGMVTSFDQITNVGAGLLQAGVFINPATINGVANTPTPGNYIFIFTGEGRVFANITTANNTPAIGDIVVFDVAAEVPASSGFQSYNQASVSTAQGQAKFGNAVQVPVTGKQCVVKVRGLFGNSLANQGV